MEIDLDGVRIGEANIGFLAYADDTVLLAKNKEQLKRQSKNLIKAASRIGLEVNLDKTE